LPASAAVPAPGAEPGLDHPIFIESIRLIRAALTQQGFSPAADPVVRDVVERCIHSSGDLGLAQELEVSAAACAAGLAALAAGAPILTDTAMAAAAVTPMAKRTFANPVHCLLDWAPARAPVGDTRSAIGLQRAWAELAPKGLAPAGLAPAGVAPGSSAPMSAGPVSLAPMGLAPMGLAPTSLAPMQLAPMPLAPVILIGSAPTALERLLDCLAQRDQGRLDQAQPQAVPGPNPGPALVIGMPVGFVGVAESKRRLAASGLAHIGLRGSKGGAALVAASCNALLRAAWLQAAGW
jgi:precorrin-8X/cobalt-precorrin-8 methylmutase